MAGNVTLLNLAVDSCAAAAPLLLGGGRAAIDLYLLHAGPTSANPPHGTDSRQTDGHPTATQLHRSCSAYYAECQKWVKKHG